MATPKNLTHRAIVGIAYAVFIGAAFSMGTYYWVLRNTAVAKVNSQYISHTEYASALAQDKKRYSRQIDFSTPQGMQMLGFLKKNTMDRLIENRLIEQEAYKMGISVGYSELQSKLDEQIQQNFGGDKEQFYRTLNRVKMTIGMVTDGMKKDLLKEKVKKEVNKDVKVSEKELKEDFEKNKSTYSEPEKIEAKHILFKVEEGKPESESSALKKASDVLNKIKAGESFEELAKIHSEDTSNKEKSGDLGAFKKGDMVKPFENAAWALKEGEFTRQLVKTTFGYHIIKRGKTILAKNKSFKEVKVTIEKTLISQKKQRQWDQWLKQVKQQAMIEVNEQVTATPPPLKIPSPPAVKSNSSPAPKPSATGKEK